MVRGVKMAGIGDKFWILSDIKFGAKEGNEVADFFVFSQLLFSFFIWILDKQAYDIK